MPRRSGHAWRRKMQWALLNKERPVDYKKQKQKPTRIIEQQKKDIGVLSRTTRRRLHKLAREKARKPRIIKIEKCKVSLPNFATLKQRMLEEQKEREEQEREKRKIEEQQERQRPWKRILQSCSQNKASLYAKEYYKKFKEIGRGQYREQLVDLLNKGDPRHPEIAAKRLKENIKLQEKLRHLREMEEKDKKLLMKMPGPVLDIPLNPTRRAVEVVEL